MEIDRPQETAFLKAKFLVDRKVTELKIVTEPDYVETEFQGKKDKKLQCEVNYNTQTNSDPNIWTMNKTTSITLYDHFGKDTSTWMNKPLPINVSGEGEKMAIMVDKVRLG